MISTRSYRGDAECRVAHDCTCRAGSTTSFYLVIPGGIFSLMPVTTATSRDFSREHWQVVARAFSRLPGKRTRHTLLCKSKTFRLAALFKGLRVRMLAAHTGSEASQVVYFSGAITQ